MLRSLARPALVLVAALLLLLASPAVAGDNSWTSRGPEGGAVTSLVTAGSSATLYVGLFEDVLRSVDGGRTWVRASRGLGTDTGLPGVGPFYLAVDPRRPKVLYAGSSLGIYKTFDGGASWRPLANDLGIRHVQKIAVSPAAPGTVWVGTAVGLFVSRNAGARWSRVEGGYPVAGEGEATVQTLEVVADPTRAGTVYASSTRGLFKTIDDGVTWTRLLEAAPLALALDPARPWMLYAGGLSFTGILRSEDGGGTWTPLDNEMSAHEVRALGVHPGTSTVYAAAPAAPGRVYRSDDDGTTWTGAGGRLPATGLQVFALDAARPGIVYVGSLAGVWKSTSRGRVWAPANDNMVETSTRAVAVAPSDPRIVYASVDHVGVFKSTNRGESWSKAATGPEADLADLIGALLVDPEAPATVFAGTDAGIFRSTDAGATWARSGPAVRVLGLALEPAPGSRLYAATEAGAFASDDRGETWSPIWPSAPGSDPTVRHVAVSPSRPSEVYLSAPSGLFASYDRGATWTRLPAGPLATFSVAVDPRSPSTLYLSAGDPSLLKSTDGGQTWASVGVGLPNATVTGLVIDPVRPNRLYAATWLGVFRSIDGGASWAPLGGRLPAPAVALALDRSGPVTVHVATFGGGVVELTER